MQHRWKSTTLTCRVVAVSLAAGAVAFLKYAELQVSSTAPQGSFPADAGDASGLADAAQRLRDNEATIRELKDLVVGLVLEKVRRQKQERLPGAAGWHEASAPQGAGRPFDGTSELQVSNSLGKCMVPEKADKNTAKLYLVMCGSFPGAWWRYDSRTGQLRNSQGKCLDALERKKDYGTVHMWSCDTANLNQQWVYNDATGQIKSRDGNCLAAASAGQQEPAGDPSVLRMRVCDENDKYQRWSISGGPVSGPSEVYKHKMPDWDTIWSRIRIYTYPEEFKEGDEKRTSGYPYTEQFLHKHIKEVSKESPEEANLFYLPALTTGWGNSNSENETARLNAYFDAIYTKYPYWRNASGRGRINHFWVAGHDHGGNRARDSKFYRDRSMLLVNSASTCRGLPSCEHIEWYGVTPKYFDVSKDVSTVAFPSVATSTAGYPPMLVPMPHRDIAVYFVGGYLQRRHVLSVLDRDARIQNDPSWRIVHDGLDSINKKARDKDYWGTLQRTKYALHIHGTQPFSSRLFEAIVAGAVPIVIAPGYVLPFEELLDWNQFSVCVQPNEVSRLYDIVSRINVTEYRRLARNVVRVADHFRYHPPDIRPGDAFYMTIYQTFLRSQQAALPHVSSGVKPELGRG